MKNPLFRTYEPSDYRTFGLESSHHDELIYDHMIGCVGLIYGVGGGVGLYPFRAFYNIPDVYGHSTVAHRTRMRCHASAHDSRTPIIT